MDLADFQVYFSVFLPYKVGITVNEILRFFMHSTAKVYNEAGYGF